MARCPQPPCLRWPHTGRCRRRILRSCMLRAITWKSLQPHQHKARRCRSRDRRAQSPWRPWQAAAFCQRGSDPRCDSLSDSSRRSCETVRRPLRVHTWPLNRPRQLPFSASTASIGCSSTPRPLPLPISPSPRRRFAVVEVDLAGVLDRQHMAAFHRRRRILAPAFDYPLGRHLVVAEKAVEPHFLRSPLPAAAGRHPLPTTMHSMSAAPLYRDDDPRTDLMTSLCAPACRHPCQNRSAAIEITRIPNSESPSDPSIRRTSVCSPSAKAGTHNPCRLFYRLAQFNKDTRAFLNFDDAAYGSPPSRGRLVMHPCHYLMALVGAAPVA